MNTYKVKNKHLPGAGGNYNKFITADQNTLRKLGKEAIKNTPMKNLKVNSPDSYKLVYDFGRTIGSKSLSAVRLVFSKMGKIITFFPC